MHNVPSLVDLCIQIAIANVRYLGDVGETDFHLLERILPHCTLDQLMHVENSTKGRDLSPVTDELWKKFYMRQFGIESANLVVERMGQKRVIFKWKQLYEAKLKDREEATQKSLDRIKKRYQEEDAIMSTESTTSGNFNTTTKTLVVTSLSGGDISSLQISTHHLNGRNYLQWAQSVKIVICARGSSPASFMPQQGKPILQSVADRQFHCSRMVGELNGTYHQPPLLVVHNGERSLG